jgi:hypothetical protein
MGMGDVRDAVVGEGVATPSEYDEVREEVRALTEDPSTMVASARFFQVWGYRRGEADGSSASSSRPAPEAATVPTARKRPSS